MKKKDNPIVFVAMLAAALYMMSGGKLPDIKIPSIPFPGGKPAVESVVYPEPSAELKTKVSEVTARFAAVENHKEDAAHLAALYAALADAIARDDSNISSTGQIRIANKKAGAILFAKRSIAGKYPGLRETVEGIVADALGKENKPLDDALRKKAVDVFNALAWACYQAAK